jgi:chitodextrinase
MRSTRLLLGAALGAALLAGAAGGATALPVVWTAGGLDAGSTGAGQAARIASDPAGNVAVVSGPAVFRDLAVTSYAPTGQLRWRGTVSPSIGVFVGDWVAAAPNGDFVAVGHNVTSRGQPIAITLVRFGSGGALQWRVDIARTFPNVGRLLVDSAGNAYLVLNALGDGQDIELQKYGPGGALLWSRVVRTGPLANDVATSLALSPDETDVVLTGNVVGGATWITAAFDTATGTRRWLTTAAEGPALRDVVVDATRVYVTGMGATGASTPALAYWLTVVAYDRATGARLWRTDRRAADATEAAGRRLDLAPDGSLVVAGVASRGFLDWYTVALERTGAVRWEAVRDGGLNTDEIPAHVLVLRDGTAAVTGRGGPNLPGGFIQGVTAGYGPDGTLRWEAFARMETLWETELPDGTLCATGGYDALVTCWREGATPPPPANSPPQASFTTTALSGYAPLTVGFDGSASTDSDGRVVSWAWSFGDGGSATAAVTTHVYTTPGIYTASLTVTDDDGATSRTTRMLVVSALLPPDAPASLTATALGSSSIGLTWMNLSIEQTAVSVERCRGAGCNAFAVRATLPGTASSFVDTGLAARTTYRYRVRAQNAAGVSPYSYTVSARTTR